MTKTINRQFGTVRGLMRLVLGYAELIGIDTPIGLAIVRDLGVREVPVHGIARGANDIGMSSRYLRKGYIRAAGEEALVQQLFDLGERLGESCLFVISESDIALLNRHRGRLRRFRFMFPDEERMNRVVNKEMTFSAATKIGIHVPQTVQVRTLVEAAAAAESLRFPVVLKWANPNEAHKLLSPAGLALHKSHYCYTAHELLSYLRRYESVNMYPLIQEYCPGFGLGQFILMRDGHAHFRFQHQRIHEWPPEGGFSSVRKSVSIKHHQELMDKSIALLRALDWEGLAMVEYRHDPSTGNSALMEINGRFWGSLPLACYAGASFPWFVYKLFGLNEAIEPKSFKLDVRCRFMVPETKRLVRILFNQERIEDRYLKFRRLPEIAQYLFDFIRPRTCYFVFDPKDPAPFISDLTRGLRSASQRRKC